MKTYVVKHYTWIDGRPHGVGKHVELSDAKAEGLIKGGLIEPVDGREAKGEKKSKAPANQGPDQTNTRNAGATAAE